MNNFIYVVSFGGGIGPDVWDEEIIIRAGSIREALDDLEQYDSKMRLFSQLSRTMKSGIMINGLRTNETNTKTTRNNLLPIQ